MEYPENDEQFEEQTLTGVEQNKDGGWTIKYDGAWCFFVDADSPVVPEVGMAARFYGRGIGSRVRGLFLDGVRVFYRTEVEDEERAEVDLYGADAKDWLKRWDEGKSVWSIEMGRLGPGYEQCIQITAAEILRHLLDAEYDAAGWERPDIWKRDRDLIEAAGHQNAVIKELGLSGAQWGGAMNIAANLYRDGPRKIMNDDRVKDRKIQVRRDFPQGKAA